MECKAVKDTFSQLKELWLIDDIVECKDTHNDWVVQVNLWLIDDIVECKGI